MGVAESIKSSERLPSSSEIQEASVELTSAINPALLSRNKLEVLSMHSAKQQKGIFQDVPSKLNMDLN